MATHLGTFLLGTLVTLPLLFWLFYKYYTRNYNYWKLRGVSYGEPVFPFGTLKNVLLRKKYIGLAFDELYKRFSQEKYFGVYELNRPTLVVRDPNLARKIMVKDFQHFMDRSLVPLPKDSLAKNLFWMTGQEWKDMRHKLTPTFTSGKMKMMYLLMEKCSIQLKEYLTEKMNQNQPINAKDVLARFTMDIIATCAFGLEINSLAENSKIFDLLVVKNVLNRPSFTAQFVALFLPACVKRMLAQAPFSKTRATLNQMVKDTIEYRGKNKIVRNDFLDLLININKNKYVDDGNELDTSKDQVHQNDMNIKIAIAVTYEMAIDFWQILCLASRLQSIINITSCQGQMIGRVSARNRSPFRTRVEFTMEQITAQAFLFFMAGFETTSSAMTFALYELSRHPDIQTKLHNQIKEAVDNNDGHITYQLLTEIPYLEQVINETLRLYGAASVISRTCTQTYQMPDSDLVVEKGQRVLIPLYSFHHDPQYFPDPFEFRPERFSPENSRGRHPYVFLPFAEGPRNCIGMRFGLLQLKLGLATVILNFEVSPSPDNQAPIQFSTTSLVTMPDSTVWVVLKNRNVDQMATQ